MYFCINNINPTPSSHTDCRIVVNLAKITAQVVTQFQLSFFQNFYFFVQCATLPFRATRAFLRALPESLGDTHIGDLKNLTLGQWEDPTALTFTGFTRLNGLH